MSKLYQRKDHLHEQAKEEGYRSRAAYKLIEIQKKYRIFKKKNTVMDLGAWPGGWLQVAQEFVGEEGCVYGIDLAQIEDLNKENIFTYQIDINDLINNVNLFTEFNMPKVFDVIISDMSPKLTGIRERDIGESYALLCLSIEFQKLYLKNNGNFIVKTFPSPPSDLLIKGMKKSFKQVVKTTLESTRQTSKEQYFIGIGKVSI